MEFRALVNHDGLTAGESYVIEAAEVEQWRSSFTLGFLEPLDAEAIAAVRAMDLDEPDDEE